MSVAEENRADEVKESHPGGVRRDAARSGGCVLCSRGASAQAGGAEQELAFAAGAGMPAAAVARVGQGRGARVRTREPLVPHRRPGTIAARLVERRKSITPAA